jgi:hypothetical protein
MQKKEEEEEEKTGGLGELGRRKRQNRRIAQRLLYKDNKRRNRQKKDGSKAHGQKRQTGERGGSGRRGGVCHCFRVWFECVALLGFSILIRTVWGCTDH